MVPLCIIVCDSSSVVVRNPEGKYGHKWPAEREISQAGFQKCVVKDWVGGLSSEPGLGRDDAYRMYKGCRRTKRTAREASGNDQVCEDRFHPITEVRRTLAIYM